MNYNATGWRFLEKDGEHRLFCCWKTNFSFEESQVVSQEIKYVAEYIDCIWVRDIYEDTYKLIGNNYLETSWNAQSLDYLEKQGWKIVSLEEVLDKLTRSEYSE